MWGVMITLSRSQRGCLVRERFRIGDVQRRPTDRSGPQRRHQIVGVDQRTTRDVDDPRVFPHQLEASSAEHPSGLRRRRRGDHDVIHLGENLIQPLDGSRRACAVHRSARSIHADDAGPEWLEHPRERGADPAGPYDRDGCARPIPVPGLPYRGARARYRTGCVDAGAERRPAATPARARPSKGRRSPSRRSTRGSRRSPLRRRRTRCQRMEVGPTAQGSPRASR